MDRLRQAALALAITAAPASAQQYPTEWRYMDMSQENGWHFVFREIATVEACRSMIGEVVETYLGGPERAGALGMAASQVRPDEKSTFHIRIDNELVGYVGCTTSSDPALQGLRGPEDAVADFMERAN